MHGLILSKKALTAVNAYLDRANTNALAIGVIFPVFLFTPRK